MTQLPARSGQVRGITLRDHNGNLPLRDQRRLANVRAKAERAKEETLIKSTGAATIYKGAIAEVFGASKEGRRHLDQYIELHPEDADAAVHRYGKLTEGMTACVEQVTGRGYDQIAHITVRDDDDPGIELLKDLWFGVKKVLEDE